jgi:hypothetical protein
MGSWGVSQVAGSYGRANSRRFSKITESLGVLKRMVDRVVRDWVIATNPCLL